MSAGDDILARLDAATVNQVKCPVCGRADDLYQLWADWQARMVAAPITGGLVASDNTDSDYFELYPEDQAAVGINLPKHLLACGNFADHDAPANPPLARRPWVFFVADPTIQLVWDNKLFDDVKGHL